MDANTLKIYVTAETSKFTSKIKQASKDAAEYIKEELKKATEGIKESAGKIFDKTKKAGETFKSIAKNFGSILLSAIKLVAVIGTLTILLAAVSGFTSLFVGAMGLVKSESQETVNKFAYLKAMLQSAYRALYDIAYKFINWVLDGIIKIAYWIDYIVQAWFGISLLSKTSEEYEKNMKQAAKDAKEINKQLMGFDEANVLGKDSSGNNGNKPLTPTAFDPGKIEIPWWVDWLAENKETIITVAGILGIAFGASKIREILGNLSLLFGAKAAAGTVGGTGLAGLFSSLAAIAAIAASIAIIVWVAARTWQDLKNLGDEIDKITEKQKKYNEAWKEGVNAKNAEEMASLVETQKVNFTAAYDMLKKANGPLGKIGHNAESWAKSSLAVVENSKATVDKLYDEYKLSTTTKERKKEILEILEGIKEDQSDIITDASEWTDETDNAYDAYFGTWHIIDDIKDDLGIVEEKTEGIHETGIKFIDDMNRKMGLLKDTEEDLQTPWGELKNTAIGILNEISNYKIGDKKFNLKAILDTGIINKALDAYDKFKANSTGLWGQSITMLLNPLMNNLRKYKAASGAIVNLPGTGVPVGNNVWAGEAGREGVIPLTDANAMSSLGREIGQWVNISLLNQMIVDGQVLATATNNQINKERFLMNR